MTHLRRQHALVSEEIVRLRDIQQTLELMIEARVIHVDLTPEETFEIFGGDDPERHRQEAEQRWGDTDAYRESTQRSRRYGPDEWRRIKSEADDIEESFAELLRNSSTPQSRPARRLAERHRLHICEWFYPCDRGMHAELADLYRTDVRFAAHYESRESGLADFVSSAIRANADDPVDLRDDE